MAAIPIPYTFVTGTIIDPDQMNANFQAIAVNAVSDVGGVLDAPTLNNATVTGDLLFLPDATSDIGKTAASRPRDLFLARNAAVGGALTVNGAVAIHNHLTVDGNTNTGGLAQSQTLYVAGAASLAGTVDVGGLVTINNHLNVTGNTTTSGLTQSQTLFVGGTTTLAGTLTVTAFGIHSFDAAGTGPQVLSVRNTNAGPANFARVRVGNDVSSNTALLDAFASNYAASGVNIPDTAKVDGTGIQGLTLAATAASGPIRFFSGGVTERMRLHASGGLSLGNAIDPGAGGLRVTGNSGIGGSLQVSSGLTAGSVYAIAGIQADGLFYGSGESNPNLFSSGMAVGGGTRTLGGAPDSAAPTAWIYVRYNNTTYQIPVW